MHTRGYAREFPLATALLALDARPNPLARTLAWLALELQLAASPLEHVESIAQWMRGLANSRGGDYLVDTLGDCNGLVSLRRRMDLLRQSSPGTQVITGHQQFDGAWEQWLLATIYSLLRSADDDDSPSDLAATDNTVSLASPEAAIIDPLTEGWSTEPEDDSTPTARSIPSALGHESLHSRLSQATGDYLFRKGSPDLLRAPSNILPNEIAAAHWAGARRVTTAAITASDLAAVEEGLAHMLAIEAGLTQRELRLTMFGETAIEDGPAIDLAACALRRTEVRPRHAVDPSADQAEHWAETGGDILFPLSSAVLSLAGELLSLRDLRSGSTSTRLLISQADVSGALRRSIARVAPIGVVNAADYRARLAAGLAESLGPDAAQIAYGDTFGSSAAPTYYSAFEAASLVTVLAGLNAPISEEPLSQQCLDAAGHVVGSRVRPRHPPFAEVWQSMGVAFTHPRGRPRHDALLQLWQKRRDCLAVHLLLATGHRPSKAFGRIRLTDFLPQLGMVLITDKRSDPARMTRLVATGWRFVGALELYVRELRRIAHSTAFGAQSWVGDAARRILRGEAPLFSLPGEECLTDCDIGALISTLPKPWSLRPNLHRHALNQALIRARVDPEVRYFQLGWLDSEMHAVSDAAPTPPSMLGRQLGDAIDAWLSDVGWEGGVPPSEPAAILGELPFHDFQQDIDRHLDDHRERKRELRVALAKRRRLARPEVASGIAEAFSSLVPELVLAPPRTSSGIGELRRRHADGPRPHVDKAVVANLLSRFAEAPYKPIHADLAPRVLSSLLLRGVRSGVCTAALPAVRARPFSHTSMPSPFVPNIGLAVAHSLALRSAIRRRAASGDLNAEGLAALFVWSVMAYTRHRTVGEACAIASAAQLAESSSTSGWLYRIPIAEGHSVISGPPALLLARLKKAPDWVQAVASVCAEAPRALTRIFTTDPADAIFRGVTQQDTLARMLGALHVAAPIELNGPERLLFSSAVRSASVTAQRASSCEDGISIEQNSGSVAEPMHDVGPHVAPENLAAGGQARSDRRVSGASRDLMRFFNPRYVGEINGRPAESAKQRKRQLLPLVEQRIADLGQTTSVEQAMVAYIRHLLCEGGPRSKGGMRIGTIYKIYSRIRPVVDALGAGSNVNHISAQELTTSVLAAMGRSTNQNKPDVLRDIRSFLNHLMASQGAAEPDWDRIFHAAGIAVIGTDPAVVSDAEAKMMLDVLAAGIDEQALIGVDPIERRQRELQFASALLLEASGVRPDSLFGLTLADIHFFGESGYLHLKRSGPFASVKTLTSVGFVPLESELWGHYSEWIRGWYSKMQSRYEDHQHHLIPLFQQPEAPVGQRYPLNDIIDRIGELLRWSTRQSAGRTYWLRKRRVLTRHGRVASLPTPRARDVVRAMRISGHECIVTPLAHYLGDLLAYIYTSSAVAAATDLQAASDYSGIAAGVIHQRWRRLSGPLRTQSAVSIARLAAVLRRKTPEWQEPPRAPPPRYRPRRNGLSWRAIERVMIALAAGWLTREASLRTDVDESTVEAIKMTCAELSQRTGWAIDGRTRALSAPRRTAMTAPLLDLIVREDPRLAVICREWAQCARVPAPDDACVLIDPEAVAAFRSLVQPRFSLSQGVGDRASITHRLVLDGQKVYGAMAAVRWVCAVTWVALRWSHRDKPQAWDSGSQVAVAPSSEQRSDA